MCDHNDTYTRSLEKRVDSLLRHNDVLRRLLEEKQEGEDK